MKQTLDSFAYERDDLLELDTQALLADPEHATTLPPAVLVRAVVVAAEANQRLCKELDDQRSKAVKLQRKLRGLRREDAARRARLGTLEEVIAALHANLEDLRLERDRPRLAGPQAHALRAGTAQIPRSSSGVNSCE